MFRATFVAVLATASSAAAKESNSMRTNTPTRQDIEYMFEEWRREFGMEFESAEEHIKRLNIFAANHIRILEHNKSGASYTMDHNKFSHLTPDEFSAQFIGGFSPYAHSSSVVRNNSTNHHEFDLDLTAALPDSVDWTSAGAVTEVKNQGQCGACWTFSTTGALESRYFLKTGELAHLSQQELVECDGDDAGCHGGSMDNGFLYAQEHGLSAAESYPYSASDEKSCRESLPPRALPKNAVKGFVDVPKGDEAALQAAVAEGPVSIAIEADQTSFQFYSGGVLTGSCGHDLDHAVLLVGYGASAPSGGMFNRVHEYWKVKNSWGERWGERGYIRIQRGNGECGIADAASYPTF